MFKCIIISLAIFSVGFAYSQTKTVHLFKKGMDVYMDVPEEGKVQTFAMGFFHKTDVVSIHQKEVSQLGDVYLEEFEGTIDELKLIRQKGELSKMFVQYKKETDTDLILEYQDPETKELFYEFHMVKEVEGKKYYLCSDVNKRYDWDTIMALHEIADSLRANE